MPVDIGLLRSDGGDLELVRRWQTLRYGNDGDGETSDDFSTSLLEGIQKQDTERRMILRELNACRSHLNFLQQSLSSSNENERDNMEAKHLKKHIIPTFEQKLTRITKELEKSLPRVANCVVTLDVQQLSESKHAKTSLTNARKCNEFVMDPLYCLCGYQTISGVNILTGTGAALEHSLSNYALQFLRQDQTFGSFPHAILPESISVESGTAHSVMGCLPCACPICDCTDSKIIAPSFVAASLLHQDKTYWDRQLPVGHVITTTTGSSHRAIPLLVDKREQARVNSFQRGKTKLWFQQTSGERVEMLSLTGNTLGESNEMQLRMAGIIVDFYKSLLVFHTDEPPIRTRTAAPPQLLPCEASRVIIEGVVEKKLVTLGYVSNMTDFSTRGLKTKIGCGGFCHAVHGVVCSIPETLEWMLAQNVTQDTNELGIATPSQLSISLQEQLLGMIPLDGVLFLPFYRRVHHGKNGKVTRTELNSVSKPRIIPAAGGRLLETNPIGRSKPRKAAFVREGPVTAQDIADERMSCPFDFLPIGR